MDRFSEIFNFDNVGTKIKNLVKWSCWISIILLWIGAIISFCVLVSDRWTAYFCWIPLVFAIVGPFLIWLSSWLLYAFGEMVEDIHAMRTNEDYYQEEEEEVPEKKEPVVPVSTRKAVQCSCGEMFYGLHCPVCGKRAEVSSKTRPTTPKPAENEKSKSTTCKCGWRFYGDMCPNCGRTIKEIEQ